MCIVINKQTNNCCSAWCGPSSYANDALQLMLQLLLLYSSLHHQIFSRIIHRLQRIQNSLARVVTRSTTNTTSALNSLHSLLSTVHSTTLALNTCHLYYILIRHRVSFTLPPSIASPNLVPTLLLPLVV